MKNTEDTLCGYLEIYKELDSSQSWKSIKMFKERLCVFDETTCKLQCYNKRKDIIQFEIDVRDATFSLDQSSIINKSYVFLIK